MENGAVEHTVLKTLLIHIQGNAIINYRVTADSKIKYYPEFFRTELKHPGKGVKHIVTDERKL